jgi:hypothetical protein
MTSSVLHGQCLVGGNHSPESPYTKQCPLRAAEQRSARAKKAASIRWRRQDDDSGASRASTPSLNPS